ncbi:cellulose synthase operon protein YhjQ/BcsQ [Rhodospira trueperi]|uniref:Cellulose biosynthesis protein BcsQ n=1 Tax=Rhodospira trueperi TaxID=69960 RepID=A0A1G7C062_9PROT|nr:cellulose synthase operon protein YhjQ/BcsQ [Rhodospira trueperi]SDE31815.1 Cellulose biosynthesis protein BcsQ [Rhodospira trueperi]
MAVTEVVGTLTKTYIDQGHGVVGVVASQPREGTTTVTLALARAFVDYRPASRVLLVDANPSNRDLTQSVMRGERLGRKAAKMAATERNLGEPTYLPLPDSPQQFLLSFGQGVGESGDLGLSGDAVNRIDHVLKAARHEFDLVLVDLPPVLQHRDAVQTLAPLLDTLVMVVRAAQTRRPVIEQGAETLKSLPRPLAGVILNDRPYPIPKWIYRRFF